ncbi:MAG: hypothetical protein LZF61_04310 [Nitrosomonas sp.]|nr:MAG: hypothetical protein LZF61_04310 [Nitrosomonas sp.]
MHPIVPIIMTLGIIMFVIGIIVFTRLGMQRINVIRFRGKEYQLWRFVVVTVGSGVALIMMSVLIPKYISYQPEQTVPSNRPVIAGNLKYELEAVLSSLNLNNDAIMKAINRFQSEYQAAAERGEKNAMDLLVLELGFNIRTELQHQDYPSNQIEREIERITSLVKQSGKSGTGK